MREGKNREVKKVCEKLGLKVNRLIRISFGPFMLGDLPRGGVEEVNRAGAARPARRPAAAPGLTDADRRRQPQRA